MADIQVYISAEDPVTKAVIERVMSYCSPRFKVFKEMPARGGQIKSKIAELNKLALVKPVVLLTDLDTEDCAPMLKGKLLNGMAQSPQFLLNIAIDEAEAWLMADREGFAKYFSIPMDSMPHATMQKMGGMKKVQEMSFACKSSFDLTHRLALLSTSSNVREQIAVRGTACKGKEYNTAILPFIKESWDIDAAIQNSDSLHRMIKRLQLLERQIS